MRSARLVVVLAFALVSAEAPAGSTYRVLWIGDSHSVGKFGEQLNEALRAPGGERLDVAVYAACSSTPEWFFTGQATSCGYFEQGFSGRPVRQASAPTPKFYDLLNRLYPDFTVIVQGSNYVNGPEDYVSKMTHTMLEAVAHGSPQGHGAGRCIWVGPPAARVLEPARLVFFYADLRKQAARMNPPCEVIDSRPVTPYPARGGDGMHYDEHRFPGGDTVARHWGEVTGSAIRSIIGSAR